MDPFWLPPDESEGQVAIPGLRNSGQHALRCKELVGLFSSAESWKTHGGAAERHGSGLFLGAEGSGLSTALVCRWGHSCIWTLSAVCGRCLCFRLEHEVQVKCDVPLTL